MDLIIISYTILFVSFVILAFVAGKRIADDYNNKLIARLEYLIREKELEKGIGYVPPQQPVRKYVPIGQPFMDKLKDNGRAVQKINPKQP